MVFTGYIKRSSTLVSSVYSGSVYSGSELALVLSKTHAGGFMMAISMPSCGFTSPLQDTKENEEILCRDPQLHTLIIVDLDGA